MKEFFKKELISKLRALDELNGVTTRDYQIAKCYFTAHDFHLFNKLEQRARAKSLSERL